MPSAAGLSNFVRITAWLVLAAVFWIAGALVEGRARLGLWALAGQQSEDPRLVRCEFAEDSLQTSLRFLGEHGVHC